MTGGLLIDKPAGWTSHDVVALVRRRLGLRAVGHAGTLDPFATGLLVVLTGRATRLARFVAETRKVYQAVATFGAATDTDDITGTVVRRAEPTTWPSEADLRIALHKFIGVVAQRPPAYSAKHVDGARSHELARRGVVMELPEVWVSVHRLEMTSWRAPDLAFEAEVGTGTYVRAIARDLGERMGSAAHCSALRRTRVGPFSVDDAITPEMVGPEHLRPPAAMVPHLVREVVDEHAVDELGFGRSIPRVSGDARWAALVAEDGRLIAVAESAEIRWQPVVVLEPAA